MVLNPTCIRHDWQAPDGERFSYSCWPAELQHGKNLRAVIIALHGLSGAALDYEPLGSHFVPYGISTLALELRGQGNDPQAERRGDLAQLEDWFVDLSAFLILVRKLHPNTPLYYYGESMGAALWTRFLAQCEQVDQPWGLVLASPVVALPQSPSWWQQQLFRFFLKVRPTHRMDVRRFAKSGKEPSKIVTRDEAHRQWFETAAHKLNVYTIRFFKCLFDLIDGCFVAAADLHIPVLVLYAGHDVFITSARVEEFFEHLGSQDKELRFFPEAYHLLLHDYDQKRVLDEIEQWLLARLTGKN